jgi:hypothetical protein
MVSRFLIASFFGISTLAASAEVVRPSESPWNIEVRAFQKDEKKKEKPLWGINLGAYFPVDSDISDLFGNALPRFGFSPVDRKFDKKFDIVTDVNILFANSDEARLFVLPVTVGVVFGTGDQKSKGFVAVNAGPAYYDYVLFRFNGTGFDRFDARKIGWNANVEVGLLLNNRFSITGRYDWFNKSDDFDFSGFSLNLNYTFIRW